MEELTRASRDFIGSRTIEALLKSQTVKIDKKNQFCDIIKVINSKVVMVQR